LKFTQFKVGYHEDTLAEVEAVHANPPVYLPADVDVVQKVIARRFGGEGVSGRGILSQQEL
jgi:threonine synthase